MDELRITILEDGTIRTDAGQFSPEKHQSAEEFLADVSRLTGGDSMRQRKPHAHAHAHTGQRQRG